MQVRAPASVTPAGHGNSVAGAYTKDPKSIISVKQHASLWMERQSSDLHTTACCESRWLFTTVADFGGHRVLDSVLEGASDTSLRFISGGLIIEAIVLSGRR